MTIRFRIVLAAAIAATATLPLFAVDGTLLAQSGDSPAFDVYSVDNATYSVASLAEIAALPRVFSRAGETVTATSPDDSVTTLSSPSLVSVLDAGGMWTLANSAQGSARVGVAWTVYGDGGMLATGASGPYAVESDRPGPDRKTSASAALPVAYTGDNWIGDAAKAATLRFTSPNGVVTELDLTGTGANRFRFGESGMWNVRLAMENGATREADIFISGGFSLIFR